MAQHRRNTVNHNLWVNVKSSRELQWFKVWRGKWRLCFSDSGKLYGTGVDLSQIMKGSAGVWSMPVLISVPSWQDVVCTLGSVWVAGGGRCCSSHWVHCGPCFLGGSGTAGPARPGPPSEYWAPSWAQVKEERKNIKSCLLPPGRLNNCTLKWKINC